MSSVTQQQIKKKSKKNMKEGPFGCLLPLHITQYVNQDGNIMVKTPRYWKAVRTYTDREFWLTKEEYLNQYCEYDKFLKAWVYVDGSTTNSQSTPISQQQQQQNQQNKRKREISSYFEKRITIKKRKILKKSNVTRIELDLDCWIDQITLPDVILKTLDFDTIWNIHPKEHGKVMMYGKMIDVPRWQKSYGLNYRFSGLDHKADPVIPKELKKLFDWVNSVNKKDFTLKYTFSGNKFNQLLINWYENGHHYIGYHSDDETPLIENSPIISLSLGTARKFRIRAKKKGGPGKIIKDIELSNGNMVIMGGKIQKRFTHEIVKIQGKKGEKVGKRINITFRQFK